MGQLEEINEMSAPEPMYGSSGKEPLIKKYNIPIQHFDFSYIEGCTDAKELEKILQVLKSGEEGYYPHLISKVEERLLKLKPNSRYIRKLTRVLSKNEIDSEYSNEINEDLNSWLNDINKKNAELIQTKNANKSNLPEIRKQKEAKQEKSENIPKRISSTDYAAWDKYDPDTEILKMDLEEEKLKKEAEKLAQEKHKKRTVKFNEFATSAEASFEAQRENIIANEYFKAGEYENALEHYSNSIICYSSATSYANRGAAYLSLKKYDEAISDYQVALKYSPYSYEYILQMGKCYYSLEKWSEALNCAETVIKLDPNNKGAQKLAEKAKISGGSAVSHKVRFKIVDVETKSQKVPKKSILKKEEKLEIIPIPGTSKMNGPYFKIVHSDDPNVINREKQMINNYPKRVFMTNVEITSDDDDDCDCIETHIPPSKSLNVGKQICVDDKNNSMCDENILEDKKYDLNRNSENVKTQICQKQSNKTPNWIKTIFTSVKPEKCNSEYNNDELIHTNSCDNMRKTIKSGITDIMDKSNENNNTDENGKEIARNLNCRDITSDDIGGGGEPFINDNQGKVNTTVVNMPFSFIQAWQSVRRDGTYSGFACILRNLNINRITDVIGNKIDATILSEILNCLYRHFMVADEVERVYDILLNLCRLDRFGIVIMFLSIDDKRLVHNLLDFLKQHDRDLPSDIKSQYL